MEHYSDMEGGYSCEDTALDELVGQLAEIVARRSFDIIGPFSDFTTKLRELAELAGLLSIAIRMKYKQDTQLSELCEKLLIILDVFTEIENIGNWLAKNIEDINRLAVGWSVEPGLTSDLERVLQRAEIIQAFYQRIEEAFVEQETENSNETEEELPDWLDSDNPQEERG